MTETKQIPYVLGLDLGSNSLGWAIMDLEGDKVIDVRASGSRIFEAAAEGDISSGKEESRNKKRREARGIRRNLERRAYSSFK